MNKSSKNYAEFTDERLANLYDFLWPLDSDSDFFIKLASKQPHATIIDLGCGTGILTTELAKRGHTLIGVEPAEAMLNVARNKPNPHNITWIHGTAKDIPDIQAALVIMTSHVAQFLLDDKEWEETLALLHKALKANGRLIFDSRNPEVKPWESWTKEKTLQTKMTPHGEVTVWYEVDSVKDNRVTHTLYYIFKEPNEELISINEMIFRSKETLIQSLEKAGFAIENIYGGVDGSLANDQTKDFIFECKRM